jgi:RNA polymerase sigma-70 factor (ECF subfamily)
VLDFGKARGGNVEGRIAAFAPQLVMRQSESPRAAYFLEGEVSGRKPLIPGDRELVAAMASGDVEALRKLNARYAMALTAMARRFLHDESDAEEVAADVLWQAWRDAKSFDPGRGSVASWLVTLARSRAIDRLRARRARTPLAQEQPEPEPSPDPAIELDHAQRAGIVRAALAGLEAGERAALELAYFSDLSQSEIAQRLEIPLGTVKTRIRSAMIKLRDALAGRGN